MTASLIVSALCLLLVGTLVGVRAVRAARERHWLGGTIRGLVALLLLALAALAATLTVGLHGYRALSFEEVAATVRTEPVAPQRFRATITLPDHRLAMYELAGDAFYMDAHILKWHPGRTCSACTRCTSSIASRAATTPWRKSGRSPTRRTSWGSPSRSISIRSRAGACSGHW